MSLYNLLTRKLEGKFETLHDLFRALPAMDMANIDEGFMPFLTCVQWRRIHHGKVQDLSHAWISKDLAGAVLEESWGTPGYAFSTFRPFRGQIETTIEQTVVYNHSAMLEQIQITTEVN